MALSTLLVADLDSDAPKTAMAETSARPTMSAAGGLRRAPGAAHGVLPAQPARDAEEAGQRAPDGARHGPRHGRRQHGHPDEDQHRAQAHQLMAGAVSPKASPTTPSEGDHAAPDEAAPQRDLGLGLLLGDRRHRGDPHRAAGRADGRDQRHADAHDQADDDGARLEDQRARRQRDPEAAQQLLEPDRPPARPGPGRSATTPAPRSPPRPARSGRPGVGWRRRCAADASSRVRWPTVMENVFKMVKPPTKSAMNPKTSRAVLKKPSAWPMALGRLVDHGLAGHHLDAARQRAGDGALDRRLVRPRPGRRR